MDIMELGAVGELVGGAAVIGTLIFVGFQVRHSNRLAQGSVVREGRAATIEMMKTLYADPSVTKLYLDGLRAREELPFEDRVRFDMILNQLFRSIESLFLEHRDGFMSDELWMSYEREFNPVLRQAGAVAWWLEEGPTMTPGFSNYVERALLDIEPAGKEA